MINKRKRVTSVIELEITNIQTYFCVQIAYKNECLHKILVRTQFIYLFVRVLVNCQPTRRLLNCQLTRRLLSQLSIRTHFRYEPNTVYRVQTGMTYSLAIS